MIGSTESPLCCTLTVTHLNGDKQPPSPDGKSYPPPLSTDALRFEVDGKDFPLNSKGQGQLQLTSQTKVGVRVHHKTNPFDYTMVSPTKITALLRQANGKSGLVRIDVTSRAEAFGHVRRHIIKTALAFSPEANPSSDKPASTSGTSASWTFSSWVPGMSWFPFTTTPDSSKQLIQAEKA